MAPKERVLKFDRSDADAEHKYVLVNARSKGSKPLDVKLEAIDFESCFLVSLKQDKVASLRAKNSTVSESEWRDILEKLLIQELQPEIQVSASVSEKSIDLVVRKSVQGITQRLGTVTIPSTDDQFNFLEWAGTAVDAVVETKKTAVEATAKVDQLEAEVKDLKSQLEELIQAKEDDETIILVKFRDLLNEKKIKIREQQKVIASMPVKGGPGWSQSQKTPQQSSPPPQQKSLPSRGRKPAQSRATKRKQPVAPADADQSSDDETDPMDVDKIKEEETDSGKETDDATASAASDGDDQEPSRSTNEKNATQPSQRQTSPPKKTQGAPPPKRALPFTKGQSKPEKSPPQRTGDSETESDDEL